MAQKFHRVVDDPVRQREHLIPVVWIECFFGPRVDDRLQCVSFKYILHGVARSGRPLLGNIALSRLERLIEIGDNVFDMLDAEGEPNVALGDAGLQLLLRREL